MAEIDYSREGTIARITLNRPERKNALAGEMRVELRHAFDRANEDDEVRVVVLDAAGETFCAGADVDKIQKRDPKGSRNNLQWNGHRLIRAIYTTEKPVIASVQGACVGLGLSMAMAADFIIAAEDARFSAIFTRRGLAPDTGAVFFLTRLLGQARAREMVYSTRFVGAPEAKALGMVNRVVSPAELADATRAFAGEYAEAPTYAIAMAKKMFQMAQSPSLDQFLELEALTQPGVHQTHDFNEGVTAFREKREAKFTGR
ncbi:enoyl-CoA hydratase/isomerase family protein [Vannielia litorea]|uniref:enoyl-CoA hydratase/isomerase family protein n=1 Tax=Vannielia litorea TaxID=1217970 RepID=UPI001BCAD684|nr:enoyl-CoA hydratase-related protein [Vannielia litorea]MBS8225492.1 enoyl-CoA hydratase [Vannielia litorea]